MPDDAIPPRETRRVDYGRDSSRLDLPPRPCSKCRRPFQPTVRRRMLCRVCYHGGD